jgi:hypothetical protein
VADGFGDAVIAGVLAALVVVTRDFSVPTVSLCAMTTDRRTRKMKNSAIVVGD